MVKGKTKSGFKYEIENETLNDYRLFKEIALVEEDPLRFPMLVEKLLGKEQEEALLKHLENDKGRVNPDNMMQEIIEIFNSNKDLKN